MRPPPARSILTGLMISSSFSSAAAGDATDILTVSIFDEKATAVDAGTLAYLYKDDPAVTGIAYTQYWDDTVVTNVDPFTYADNTLCIDTMTFDYQGERVEVTPDSLVIAADNKLTFTGEREIARILAANEYALVSCKTAPVVGNIIIDEGQNAGCEPFDFDGAPFGSGLTYDSKGYCGNHSGNKLIIQALTNIFPVNDYRVTLEVKVNGLTGDQGVYINGDAVDYLATTTLADNCAGAYEGHAPFETYGGPGTCTDATSVTPGGPAGCSVECANKVIRATTAPSTLGITRDGNQAYLQLGLPTFRYDSSIVKSGDVVSVRVVVFQDPCGTIFDEEIVIGTLGCVPTTSATTLLYPYFTKADGTYFWSAYAITNLSDVEGTVTTCTSTRATATPSRVLWEPRFPLTASGRPAWTTPS